LERLAAVPIVRGGVHPISGNGRKQLKVRSWAKDFTEAPDDWEERLGPRYLHDALAGSWTFFKCPHCDSLI
jgi:hypothetical protein